jgi:pyruvate formate lyase activating enzyme
MASPTGIIFDIKKFSIHDGPGIRTTVFLKGCPLHCDWCHNPEGMNPKPEIQFWDQRCISCWDCIGECEAGALLQVAGIRQHETVMCESCGQCAEVCPTEATQLIGQSLTVPEIMAEIEKDVLIYDESGGGVTFSGGEPLLQIDFLNAVLKACKEHGIHTTVDTSGYTSPERFERIRPWVDLFLYDVKIMAEDRHIKHTGVSNRRILSNLKALSQAGEEIVARIPIIPGINADTENIRRSGEFLKSLDNLRQVNILPYHRSATEKYHRIGNSYLLPEVQPPTDELMENIRGQLESFGLFVAIGG